MTPHVQAGAAAVEGHVVDDVGPRCFGHDDAVATKDIVDQVVADDLVPVDLGEDAEVEVVVDDVALGEVTVVPAVVPDARPVVVGGVVAADEAVDGRRELQAARLPGEADATPVGVEKFVVDKLHSLPAAPAQRHLAAPGEAVVSDGEVGRVLIAQPPRRTPVDQVVLHRPPAATDADAGRVSADVRGIVGDVEARDADVLEWLLRIDQPAPDRDLDERLCQVGALGRCDDDAARVALQKPRAGHQPRDVVGPHQRLAVQVRLVAGDAAAVALFAGPAQRDDVDLVVVVDAGAQGRPVANDVGTRDHRAVFLLAFERDGFSFFARARQDDLGPVEAGPHQHGVARLRLVDARLDGRQRCLHRGGVRVSGLFVGAVHHPHGGGQRGGQEQCNQRHTRAQQV